MLFMLKIVGGLKFYNLHFASAAIMVLSTICCALGKKKCYTISDLVSWQIMKDIRAYKRKLIRWFCFKVFLLSAQNKNVCFRASEDACIT